MRHKVYFWLLSNFETKFNAKMEVTFLWIPTAIGILVVISALTCFAFIFRRLQINHVMKKMLLFATAQQAIGYGIFVFSVVLIVNGLKNILTCFLTATSILASAIGTQTSVSAISITRYLPHCLGMNYYVNFLGGIGSNGFHMRWIFDTHGSWKNQNPGGCFGATS